MDTYVHTDRHAYNHSSILPAFVAGQFPYGKSALVEIYKTNTCLLPEVYSQINPSDMLACGVLHGN